MFSLNATYDSDLMLVGKAFQYFGILKLDWFCNIVVIAFGTSNCCSLSLRKPVDCLSKNKVVKCGFELMRRVDFARRREL